MDNHPKIYLYKRVVEAKCYIDNHYHQKINLEQISNQAHFSKYHFLRLFKTAFGKSPHEYLTQVRTLKAKELLKEGKSIQVTCFEVGFESVPSFIHLFKKHWGVTPSVFVKRMQEETTLKQQQPFAFVPNCFAESYGWNK